ncbi:hypothetical protein D7X33_19230 [Butyricicoccus sp. 1XD8-22]|nr:hypothetical protein D7X33_19230 [Butyricicoccus sp. 1XD8-22]
MDLLVTTVCIGLWGYLELNVYLKNLHHALKGSYRTGDTPKIFVKLPEGEPVQQFNQLELINIPPQVPKISEMPQPIVEEEDPFVYAESQLDEADEAFLAELFKETENIPLWTNESEPTKTTMEDVWVESETKRTKEQQGVSEQIEDGFVEAYPHFYEAKTNDIWLVEVIGSEAGYIHVLHEGTRKWLFIGEHNYSLHSVLKLHLDYSQGVEDVVRIEILYEPAVDRTNFYPYHGESNTMIL